jgi:hypothetical protein
MYGDFLSSSFNVYCNVFQKTIKILNRIYLKHYDSFGVIKLVSSFTMTMVEDSVKYEGGSSVFGIVLKSIISPVTPVAWRSSSLSEGGECRR